MRRARLLTILVSYCICILIAGLLGTVSTPVQIMADSGPVTPPDKDSVPLAPAYGGPESEQPFEEANSSTGTIIPVWELTRLSLVVL